LGHEIGHVLNRDAILRPELQNQKDWWTPSIIWRIAADLAGKEYSRESERRADQWGVFLMCKAGYDARRGLLWIADRAQGETGGPLKSLTTYLSTHPSWSERFTEASRYFETIRAECLGHQILPEPQVKPSTSYRVNIKGKSSRIKKVVPLVSVKLIRVRRGKTTTFIEGQTDKNGNFAIRSSRPAVGGEYRILVEFEKNGVVYRGMVTKQVPVSKDFDLNWKLRWSADVVCSPVGEIQEEKKEISRFSLPKKREKVSKKIEKDMLSMSHADLMSLARTNKPIFELDHKFIRARETRKAAAGGIDLVLFLQGIQVPEAFFFEMEVRVHKTYHLTRWCPVFAFIFRKGEERDYIHTTRNNIHFAVPQCRRREKTFDLLDYTVISRKFLWHLFHPKTEVYEPIPPGSVSYTFSQPILFFEKEWAKIGILKKPKEIFVFLDQKLIRQVPYSKTLGYFSSSVGYMDVEFRDLKVYPIKAKQGQQLTKQQKTGPGAPITTPPTATWTTPPPPNMTAGQDFTVAWRTTGSPTHVNVHWSPTDPLATGCCLGATNTTDSSTVSPTNSPATLTANADGRLIANPTEVRYVVHVSNSAGSGKSTIVSVMVKPIRQLVVNGNKVTGLQEKWVRFVASEVVPQLLGNRTDRIRVASRSTWWGLKEGTFSLVDPHAFSVCSVLLPNGRSKDERLGPLDVCSPGRAWQVGLAAVQVPNFTETEVLNTVNALWPGSPPTPVPPAVATLAGFDPTQGTGAAIVASSGDLRKSWLLRHPVVGITLVEINVTAECIDDARSFCYGTGWTDTRKYAPRRDAALENIGDVAAIFNLLSP